MHAAFRQGMIVPCVVGRFLHSSWEGGFETFPKACRRDLSLPLLPALLVDQDQYNF
jgi:hypothetical protein